MAKQAEMKAPQAPASKSAEGDWNDDFESAPRDIAILITPDGEQKIEAMWRKTRRYDGEQHQWVEDGYWADPVMRRRFPFEPLGWMRAPAQQKAPMSVA